VWTFMRRDFLKRSDADVEIVEAFDGLRQSHTGQGSEGGGVREGKSSRRVEGYAPRDGRVKGFAPTRWARRGLFTMRGLGMGVLGLGIRLAFWKTMLEPA
jgi:hypothetical protein